ncbi:MAG: DUF4258 domain-containing protein [Nitrospinota bacterium]|nr:DUF4258 domain-containing protein [Nitrospinota bacterium]
MECKSVYFSRHAIERMFQRSITPDDVLKIITDGEVIYEYTDDKPFPSLLILGEVNAKHIHIVAAKDETTATCHVVTVYEPDPDIWSDDYRTRRKI